MKIFWIEIKNHILFCLTIIAGFGAIMSVKGASVESLMSVGITQRDMQNAADAAANVPALTGILPLAAEQNMWLSFRYAVVGALAGMVVTLVWMAAYCKWKDTPFMMKIRRWCRQGE